jgi:hypothetical protein
MADPSQPIIDHVLDALLPKSPSYGPQLTPPSLFTSPGAQTTQPQAAAAPPSDNPLVKAANAVDSGLYALHQYGKGAGDLPKMPIQRIDDGVSRLASSALPPVRALIDRYRNPGPPAVPTPPAAPGYATDPQDRGMSMGMAWQKPGGWY